MMVMDDVRNMWERINGNDRDLAVERVLLMAGVNHPQVLKTQVLNGSVHGAVSAGSLKIGMSSKDFQGSLSEESEKVPKETWQVKSVEG
jgi:hypothetical protein